MKTAKHPLLHRSIKSCDLVEIDEMIRMQIGIQRRSSFGSKFWGQCEEQIERMKDHRDTLLPRT